jgi:hypothetical protein
VRSPRSCWLTPTAARRLTLSRDLIDLAFAAVHYGKGVVREGLDVAGEAYGSAVRDHLEQSLRRFQIIVRAPPRAFARWASTLATLRRLRVLRSCV